MRKNASGEVRKFGVRTVDLGTNRESLRAGGRYDGEITRPKEPNWTAWANDFAQCGCWMAELTDKFVKCLGSPAGFVLGKKHHESGKTPGKWDELVIRLGRSPAQRCVNHFLNRTLKFRRASGGKC